MRETFTDRDGYYYRNNLVKLLQYKFTLINIYLQIRQRKKRKTCRITMTILISLFIIGWVAAAVIGTMAYFRGEQSKPIHERNWNSDSFEKLANSITGCEIDYTERVPAYRMDAYGSNNL